MTPSLLLILLISCKIKSGGGLKRLKDGPFKQFEKAFISFNAAHRLAFTVIINLKSA